MSDFQRLVFSIVKNIPKGKVTTYKIIAAKLNLPKSYRAVGNALNKNRDFLSIPCHRVVKSDGSLGGYVKGTSKKMRILKKEGIKINNNKSNNEVQYT